MRTSAVQDTVLLPLSTEKVVGAVSVVPPIEYSSGSPEPEYESDSSANAPGAEPRGGDSMVVIGVGLRFIGSKMINDTITTARANRLMFDDLRVRMG